MTGSRHICVGRARLAGLVLVALLACKNEDAASATAAAPPAPSVGADGNRSDSCQPCAEQLGAKARAGGVETVDFAKVILIKPVGGANCLLDYTLEDPRRGGSKRPAVSFVSVPCSCDCRDFPLEDDNEDASNIDGMKDE